MIWPRVLEWNVCSVFVLVWPSPKLVQLVGRPGRQSALVIPRHSYDDIRKELSFVLCPRKLNTAVRAQTDDDTQTSVLGILILSLTDDRVYRDDNE